MHIALKMTTSVLNWCLPVSLVNQNIRENHCSVDRYGNGIFKHSVKGNSSFKAIGYIWLVITASICSRTQDHVFQVSVC